MRRRNGSGDESSNQAHPGDIVVFASRWKCFTWTAVGLVLTALSLAAVLLPGGDLSVPPKNVAVQLTVIFVAIGLFLRGSIRALCLAGARSPMVIVGDQGIWINPALYEVAPMPWSSVGAFTVSNYRFPSHATLRITPRERDRIRSHDKSAPAWLHRLFQYPIMPGGSIYLSDTLLSESMPTLFQKIRDRYGAELDRHGISRQSHP